ncbi:uncharacterized protein LOC107853054 [Capsicum annuum]|uniref:uncharacterized protein LOC107853054 n=1 Tax=Capsicum annuum TaxID=4072 RepID=UPI0007BFC81C|nr:uncharacterized protein LOC107853054 [Capsicum annuum]
MLIAVTVDANRQIFPLALAIVNKETKEAWSWFLSCLRIHMVVGRRGVTYISDRAPTILRSFNDLVELHQPNAYHRFCLRHVKSNFLSNFPNKQLEGLMWQAAIQHQECKFKAVMQCLKDAEPGAYNFLMKILLEKWTVHRDGDKRWGILTTSLSESFNGFLKKSRGLPITTIIKLTYGQILKRFVSRKQYAQELINEKELWPPVVVKKILKYELKSKNHQVTTYNGETGVFEVETYLRQGHDGRKHIIKFSRNTCECQKWQAYHMPCSHVLKVTEQINKVAHDLVSEYYSMVKYFETYRVPFQPLGDESNWPKAPFKMICNETFIRKKGSRKTTRAPNEMDIGRTRYSKS